MGRGKEFQKGLLFQCHLSNQGDQASKPGALAGDGRPRPRAGDVKGPAYLNDMA